VNIKPGDVVRLRRSIFRTAEGQSPADAPRPATFVEYARRGDEGVVQECFRPEPQGMGEVKDWHAKVRMLDGQLKTFRLTSLEVVEVS
jgi:hypothetical protein